MSKASRQTLGALLLLVTLTAAGLLAQTTTPPPQTFSTTIYLDYRYFLSTSGPLTLKPATDTTAYLSNQFLFRRAYFTYENKINNNLKFRFRLDADNTANVTGVSLTGSPVTGVSRQGRQAATLREAPLSRVHGLSRPQDGARTSA